MSILRFSFISLLLLCSFFPMHAQWDVPFSHYWAIRSFYNPAFAGATDQKRTAAAYRYEWAGVENAPQKIALAADLPIEFLHKRQGVGLVLYGEQTGLLRNALLAAQYSYRMEFSKGAMQIGLQAGIYSLQFDSGNRDIIHGEGYGKPFLRVNEIEKQLPDLNAGIAWSDEKTHIGLSLQHIPFRVLA